MAKEKENPMAKVISRCWQDEEFKNRLMADPAATLKAEGVKLAEGMAIKVVEDGPNVRTIVIPAAPQALQDGALPDFAAGKVVYISRCSVQLRPIAVD